MSSSVMMSNSSAMTTKSKKELYQTMKSSNVMQQNLTNLNRLIKTTIPFREVVKSTTASMDNLSLSKNPAKMKTAPALRASLALKTINWSRKRVSMRTNRGPKENRKKVKGCSAYSPQCRTKAKQIGKCKGSKELDNYQGLCRKGRLIT